MEPGCEQECIALLQEIESLSQQQDTIWDAVNTIVTHNEDVSLQIELISDARRHQLFTAQDKAASLATDIAESAKVAKQSSRRVKELDTLKARVTSALDLATGIAKQRLSLDGTTEALAQADFERAADYIHSYCEIEEQLQDIQKLEQGEDSPTLRGGGGDDDGAGNVDAETNSEDSDMVEVTDRTGYSLRETSHRLQAKREEVREAIRAEFNKAASEGDRDGVLRLSRLFGKLGIAEEGQLQYCNWLRQGCSAQLTSYVGETLREIEAGSPQHTHLDLVSQVIDHVVNMLESEEEHVSAYFGGAGVATMFAELHAECTSHSVSVLNSFLRGSTALLFSLKDDGRRGGGGGGDDDDDGSGRGGADSPFDAGGEGGGGGGVDAEESKRMDKMLDEISHLANFCNLYFGFVQERLAKVETSKEAVDAVLANTELQDKLQELLKCYVPLQQKYFTTVFQQAALAACRKAAAAGEAAGVGGGAGGAIGGGGAGDALSFSPAAPGKMGQEFMSKGAYLMGNLTSNVATNLSSNAFGIFGGDSGADHELQFDALLVMLDDVFTVLRTCLPRAMRIRTTHVLRCIVNCVNDVLRERLLQLIMDRLLFKKDTTLPRGCLTWLDVLQTAHSYTAKLSSEFERLAQRASTTPAEAEEVLGTAGAELEATAKTYADVLARNVQKVAGVIAKQMGKGLAAFEGLSYVIGEERLSHYEINDPWVRDSIREWSAVFAPYQESLLPENFDTLMVEVISWLTKEIEAGTLKKSFDLCGGLQLDKDIRALKQYFSSKTDRPIREKFTKLTHIAQLLTVDKISEVEDLLSSTSCVMWRLTPPEAQAVLLLRQDFSRQAVQSFNFQTHTTPATGTPAMKPL